MFNKQEYDKHYRETHKKELQDYFRKYNHNRKAELCESAKMSRGKVKVEVLTHYGNGKCECVRCGFTDARALTIDHINGNGGQHRKSLGRRSSGIYFYYDLKRQKYPSYYQTLCSNCQRIKQVEHNEWANMEGKSEIH